MTYSKNFDGEYYVKYFVKYKNNRKRCYYRAFDREGSLEIRSNKNLSVSDSECNKYKYLKKVNL